MPPAFARHSAPSAGSRLPLSNMNRAGFSSGRGLSLVVGLFLLMATVVPPASAQDKAKDAAVIYPRSSATRTEPASGSGAGYPAILLAALALAGGGGWLFWRGRSAPGATATLRKLAIAETKSLGNRQYLVVASYEDKKYLLGVCPGRIDLLTPLDGAPATKSL